MSEPARLTEAMLDELAMRWRQQGAAILHSLRPGLSEQAIEASVSGLGLSLPIEARVWWGWHDGTESTVNAYAIGLDTVYLQLGRAAELYGEQRDVALQVADGASGLTADDFWRPHWFPFAVASRPVLACDCSVPEGALTPIYAVDYEFVDESKTPVADSLGDLVSLWIEALDAGAWTYNRELHRWEDHPERLPNPNRPRMGIV
jgi:cell wall assembly regulator SMI1